jgi:hypothetical protein
MSKHKHIPSAPAEMKYSYRALEICEQQCVIQFILATAEQLPVEKWLDTYEWFSPGDLVLGVNPFPNSPPLLDFGLRFDGVINVHFQRTDSGFCLSGRTQAMAQKLYDRVKDAGYKPGQVALQIAKKLAEKTKNET